MARKTIDDWGVVEQKVLYRVIRRLIGQRVLLPKPSRFGTTGLGWREGPLTMDWVYADALNMRARRPGSEDNFRAGRMSREKVALVFKWLQERFPDEARVVENEIARLHGTVTQSNWEALVRERGVFGHVRLIPAPLRRRFSVRRYSTEEQEELDVASISLPMHHPFQLSIETTQPFLVGLQWSRGNWTALPLSQDRAGCDLSDPASRAYLEQAQFIEDTDPGLHRFVFIELSEKDSEAVEAALTVDAAISRHALDAIARLLRGLSEGTWLLHRLNAMFTIMDGQLTLP